MNGGRSCLKDTNGSRRTRRGYKPLGDIFAGEIKTVVVWRLDRLSRTLRDGINIIADWCDRDVRVVAVAQQIDLTGAVGRMLASVMFGLAEIEMEV